MVNPYEPTLAENRDQILVQAPNRYRFAGLWLICAGLIHFMGLNAILALADYRQSGDFSRFSFDWSPSMIVVAGVLVLFRFRAAISLARILGLLFAFSTVIIPLVFLIDRHPRSSISYGRLRIDDPNFWQLALIIGSVAAAILPPWWALQRALAEGRQEALQHRQ